MPFFNNAEIASVRIICLFRRSGLCYGV
jgi:hypothetical protein